MLSQLTIPRKRTSEPAHDHQQLYTIGLKHVQQLARRIWTDYNIHDPGITILELLCYALTDLGYRASFPIKDLLASGSANAENMKKQFFTARQILPNRPLTVLDYTKLLIDLKGVKNAWLKPATLTYYADTIHGKLLSQNPVPPGIKEINIAGLYDVVIEYMDDITEDKKDEIKNDVISTLRANRNLCEDFVSFTEVGTQSFLLCCELELAPDADVSKVEANIRFEVQQYLSPPVNNYTLSEMLERKKADGTAYTADEIFNGPALDCGFIDDEELAKADLRSEIRLSDLISIIMDIEGVQSVRDIVINPEGTKTTLENKWVVPVASGKKAVLNDKKSRVVFYKRNMPVEPDSSRADEYYNQLTDAVTAKVENKVVYDFDIPSGEYRHPERYYSFQNHFPGVYGIGESGLSSVADEKRKTLAYQLKAYLLFFDQIMANYFAQLSHVKDLFSTDANLHRTCFYQVVDSFAGYNKIYGTGNVVDTIQNDVEDEREKNILIDRRNRFLDHLIARFAERFNDFAHIMYSSFGSSPESMLTYKCEFLNNYPAISSERSLAYNYSLKNDNDLWNTENVSGLEKRLARLLGIHNYRRRNLGDIAYDIYAEVDKTPDDEFRFRVRKKDTGKIILSSSTKYATPELARDEMKVAIRFAMQSSGYERKTTSDGKHYFNVINDTGEVIARRIEYFEDESQMNKEIDAVMEYLRVNYSDEGMYLIENILLRPEQNDDPFLPICPAPNCTDCAGEDPYSYRMHIILPAENGRFSKMEFRRFAEQVIREETPAHILPKICWISKDDMAQFEKQYQDWIYLKAGAETVQRNEKLTSFIKKLFEVKNVYPSGKLYGCGEESDFCVEEFKPPLTIENLCSGINNDNYNIPLTATINTIAWLNELLCISDFYDILHAKKPDLSFSKNITELVDETKDCRNKGFSNLNKDEQGNIKRLNRFLLEETYPQETPKIQREKPKFILGQTTLGTMDNG